ncbi:MAG TPA: hypothetical protein DF613_01500, partial [Lachnospiraceae bacterium]|nr:hypothetical protein [Lachnospiraceae bacterium]
ALAKLSHTPTGLHVLVYRKLPTADSLQRLNPRSTHDLLYYRAEGLSMIFFDPPMIQIYL